ncbi:hypothetical protein ICW40_06245 [Actinotalea ferrariae]|uniref:hypothetical protein n=1 Tax=Actinotalea ferrariae TaxID=1386098 RepID=UPI001C8CD795|nr:hypothetical protein [Actinotalea ferrariae]MBX9244406.1 hypothetical protein [Actinotalea ferrariae]
MGHTYRGKAVPTTGVMDAARAAPNDDDDALAASYAEVFRVDADRQDAGGHNAAAPSS